MNQIFRDAANYADINTLKDLIASKPDLVGEADQLGFTALHEAVGKQNLEVVQILIAAGANVNAQNNAGFAPLHFAAYDYIAEELINSGANIHIQEHNGGTPLHLHAEKPERAEVLEILLKHGANAGIRDKCELTVLDIAKNYNGEEAVNLIKSYLG